MAADARESHKGNVNPHIKEADLPDIKEWGQREDLHDYMQNQKASTGSQCAGQKNHSVFMIFFSRGTAGKAERAEQTVKQLEGCAH